MTYPDDLVGPNDAPDDEIAAWLQARLGILPPTDALPTAAERAAIRAQVLGAPASPSSPRASGIIAGPVAALPAETRGTQWRVVSLLAAAALILIVAATLGAALRSDPASELPGAAATASVLPFAPGAALASPAQELVIPRDSYRPQLVDAVPVPGTDPNEVYVVLRDPSDSYGPPPAGCSPEEVATVMVRFFAAWSEGDTETLRSLLAPDAVDENLEPSLRPEHGYLAWFGINPIPGGIADGSGAGGYTVDDVLLSATDRHEHHEVIQVLQIEFGSTWHDRGIGMTFDLARDADDIPPHIIGGKGGIDCQTGRITLFSASDQSPVVPDAWFVGVEPVSVPSGAQTIPISGDPGAPEGGEVASPVAAMCDTDATLVLNLAPGSDTGALSALPFPVAWYRDGTITVQRGEETLRQIDIGDADFLLTTPVPGVIQASTFEPGGWHRQVTFVNIATGETLALGAVLEVTVQSGPYVFWTDEDSYTRWSVTDLRTFETVDLSERFRPEPLMPWRPFAGSLTTSADGSVVLAGTTSDTPVSDRVAPATPFPADLPPLDISHDAILINGSLDDIRLVGPLATTSGAMALSPDGKTVAWLGPNDRPGLRFVNVQDVGTGEEIGGRPINATYTNSLLFNRNGEFLYATHGTTLETIDVNLANGYSLGHSPLELPDTGYRILGASPDRTKLLLARTTSASPETSLWVDTTTGEIREFDGTPGRMFTGQVPAVAGTVTRYVTLEDIGPRFGVSEIRIVDMDTGEVIIGQARGDAPLVSISADGSTLLIPQEDGIAVWSPATDQSITFPGPVTDERTPAPAGVERVPTTFALSPNGACAVGNWNLGDSQLETVLLLSESGEQIALPDSAVGGWVASDGS